jgi:multidrug resistance efflux pump
LDILPMGFAMSHPRRVVWLLGLGLLVGTAAGAGWILNHSSAEGGAPDRSADRAGETGVVCLGFVDVEPGVTSLLPLRPGTVREVANEGTHVDKPGAVLLQLDDRLAQADLKQAEAALRESKVQEKLAVIAAKQYDEKLKQAKDAVAAGEQEIERAKQESARAAELIKVHGVSDAQKKIADIMVKKAEALLEVARAKQREAKLFEPQLEVDRAAAAVAEKTALVEKARLSLEDYQVRAPSAGTVLRALASVGEVVSPGPHGPALEFLPDKKRIIRVEVQQEFAAKVKAGQEAVVEDDSTSSKRWQGKVTRVSDWYTRRRHVIHEPFQSNDVRTVECIVEVTEPVSPPLRIGQRMRVTIKQGGL